MPYEHVNGIRMYYEVHGDAPETLVIVPGHGGHHGSWAHIVPALARNYRVVLADNRGAGLSDAPPGPYSMAQLVGDLAALHETLGLERFHLYGESLGGMIALNYVLAHPERARSLVLGCTTPGGRNAARADREALRALLPDPAHTPDEALDRGFANNFNPEWAAANRELLVRREAGMAHLRTPAHASGAQLAAAREHDVFDRLPEITQRTLVLHGALDRIIPAENGRILAERIPNAELVLLETAAHGMKVEAQAEVERHVLAFLARQSAPRVSA